MMQWYSNQFKSDFVKTKDHGQVGYTQHIAN